jgi:hypothetical protein
MAIKPSGMQRQSHIGRNGRRRQAKIERLDYFAREWGRMEWFAFISPANGTRIFTATDATHSSIVMVSFIPVEMRQSLAAFRYYRN